MTMVERVARALYEHHPRSEGMQWTDDPQGIRDHWFEMARAAIEAMREPTEAMLEEGYREAIHASTVWDVMIDAALKD